MMSPSRYVLIFLTICGSTVAWSSARRSVRTGTVELFSLLDRRFFLKTIAIAAPIALSSPAHADQRADATSDPLADFAIAVQKQDDQRQVQSWPLSPSPLPENPAASQQTSSGKSDLEFAMEEKKRAKQIDPRTHG